MENLELLDDNEKKEALLLISDISKFLIHQHFENRSAPKVKILLGENTLDNFSKNNNFNENGNKFIKNILNSKKSIQFKIGDINEEELIIYLPNNKVRQAINGTTLDHSHFVEELSHAYHGYKRTINSALVETVGVLDQLNYQFHKNNYINYNLEKVVKEITPAVENGGGAVYTLAHRWGRILNYFLVELNKKGGKDIADDFYKLFFKANEKEKLKMIFFELFKLAKENNIDMSSMKFINMKNKEEVSYLKKMLEKNNLSRVIRFN